MKKIFIISGIYLLVFAVFGATAAFAGGTFKMGIDSAGEQVLRASGNYSSSVTYDVDSSASFAFEYDTPISDNMDIGGGFEFQAPREVTGYDGQFHFMPIYAYTRLHPQPSDLTPYIVMQLGFNLFAADEAYTGTYGDTQSGMHVGFGCGFITDKTFLFELLYTVDSGEVIYPSPIPDVEVEYGKLTLSVGFVF